MPDRDQPAVVPADFGHYARTVFDGIGGSGGDWENWARWLRVLVETSAEDGPAPRDIELRRLLGFPESSKAPLEWRPQPLTFEHIRANVARTCIEAKFEPEVYVLGEACLYGRQDGNPDKIGENSAGARAFDEALIRYQVGPDGLDAVPAGLRNPVRIQRNLFLAAVDARGLAVPVAVALRDHAHGGGEDAAAALAQTPIRLALPAAPVVSGIQFEDDVSLNLRQALQRNRIPYVVAASPDDRTLYRFFRRTGPAEMPLHEADEELRAARPPGDRRTLAGSAVALPTLPDGRRDTFRVFAREKVIFQAGDSFLVWLTPSEQDQRLTARLVRHVVPQSAYAGRLTRYLARQNRTASTWDRFMTFACAAWGYETWRALRADAG